MNASLKRFELAELSRPIPLDVRLATLAAMYRHACYMGVFPRTDPLEGLNHVIEQTRAIHALRSTPVLARKEP